MNRRSFFQSLAAAAAAVVGSKLAPAAVACLNPRQGLTRTYRHVQYDIGVVRLWPEPIESDTHARLLLSIARHAARLREEQDAAIAANQVRRVMLPFYPNSSTAR